MIDKIKDLSPDVKLTLKDFNNLLLKEGPIKFFKTKRVKILRKEHIFLLEP